MNHEVNTELDRLRDEVGELKRQLSQARRRGPSRLSLVLVALLLGGLLVAGFVAGYLPKLRRQALIEAENKQEQATLPVVTAVKVRSAPPSSELALPGNVQAVTEAPVMARATGYMRRRLADIGDRVSQGQLLAEIEAPELDQQIRQAGATLDQTAAAIQQAEAALKQARSNENLARVTAGRWANLAARGVVSKQENDTYQAQYVSQQANVEALDKAVGAARSNAKAAEANLARLNQLKTYQAVRAPFAGVITVRNVDTGALVNEGNTMLFRIAQMGRLRVFVNVPQADAPSVRTGLPAKLRFAEFPGRTFDGAIARAANALDPATRTLLAEVQVPNGDGALMPGMYAQVTFTVARKSASAIIPGDTLVVRADGPQVAVVENDGTVHFAKIQPGRDFGLELEVLSGVREGQSLVVNPSDDVREGMKVKPVLESEKPKRKSS